MNTSSEYSRFQGSVADRLTAVSRGQQGMAPPPQPPRRLPPSAAMLQGVDPRVLANEMAIESGMRGMQSMPQHAMRTTAAAPRRDHRNAHMMSMDRGSQPSPSQASDPQYRTTYEGDVYSNYRDTSGRAMQSPPSPFYDPQYAVYRASKYRRSSENVEDDRTSYRRIPVEFQQHLLRQQQHEQASPITGSASPAFAPTQRARGYPQHTYAQERELMYRAERMRYAGEPVVAPSSAAGRYARNASAWPRGMEQPHSPALGMPSRIYESNQDHSPGSRIVTPAAALHNAPRMGLAARWNVQQGSSVAAAHSRAGRPVAMDEEFSPPLEPAPISSNYASHLAASPQQAHAAPRGRPHQAHRMPPSDLAFQHAQSMSSDRHRLSVPEQQLSLEQDVHDEVESVARPDVNRAPARSRAPPKSKAAAKETTGKEATSIPTPSSLSASTPAVAANGPGKRRCGRKSMNYSSEQKRERNRAAVKKCRQRQALKADYLQRKADVLGAENRALSEMLVKNAQLDDERRHSLTRGIQMDILLKIKEVFTQSLPKDFVLDADSIWDLNSVLAVSMPSRCYYGIESIKDFWRTSLRMRNKGKIRSFWAWLFRLPPGDRFAEFSIEPFSPTSNLYFVNWTTKSDPPLSGSIVILFGHGHRVTLHVEVFGWLIWRYLLTNKPFPEPPLE